MVNPQNPFQYWWLDVQRMRRYIRHPSGVPLTFTVDRTADADEALGVRDVSEGGLCFDTDHPVEPGTNITIEIPVGSPPFAAHGIVAWCRPEGGRYAIGVQFDDYVTRFSVRMVEQVCHIEHYRADVRELEGRDLSSEEAAQEWISRYAGDFPEYQS